MILNTEKCHYMSMGKDVEENKTLQISSKQKMINSKGILLFHQHIKSISKKAGQELSTLLRISHSLKIEKRKLFIIQ